MKIKRYIVDDIQELVKKKIILISGPRQVGKTYLSKNFLSKDFVYLNFDDEDDRRIILDKAWPRDKKLIILDEIHKMNNWKTWLKSIYDKEGVTPQIVVTGSARMDVFKRGGDSLAGRHYHIRLHPFSLKELQENNKTAIYTMMTLGAFPEPYLEGDLRLSKLWRKNHLDRIIREDLLDLEKVHQLKKIEILVQILSERVGSSIGFASLARDLEVSSPTIKHWLQILEDLYVVFKITPLSRNISKSILKSPKYYFYDTGRVKGDEGAKLENVVACHLLKRNHYLEDLEGEKMELHYLKDKEKREVDFAIMREDQLESIIEVKTSDANLSAHLKYFTQKLNPANSLQIVLNLKQEKQYGLIQIKSLHNYLYSLEV